MVDFNVSIVDCCYKDGLLKPSGVAGETQILFFDTVSECKLIQFNLGRNVKNRLLDFILCNIEVLVCASDVPLVPVDAYHKSPTLNLIVLI